MLGAGVMGKQLGVFTRVLASVGLASGIATQAFGQSDPDASGGDYFRRDRNESVAQRRAAREVDDSLRLGLFRVKPALALEAGFSENYAASEANPEDSPVYRVTGSLDLLSDWARHGLNARVNVPSTTYEGGDGTSNSYTTTDYVASVDGRLDVDRTFALTAGVSFADTAEPVGFADPAITLKEPARSQSTTINVGFSKEFNRLRVSGSASQSTPDFEDVELTSGAFVNVDERDVTTTTYNVRADIALTDSTSLFVSASSNQRDHDLDPPAVSEDRDSEGVAYMAGVSFDITRLMRGDIAVGTLEQTYDNPLTPEQSGATARASVELFPDELVTISISGERSIQESNTVQAATLVGTDANLELVYEFRRNIQLSVGAGYSRDEYVEIDREDERWDARASVAYELNRNVALTFSAGHIEQTSEGLDAGRNYDSNIGLIGISLRR
ncbi:MAG: outer membrane beta-barrel protein [Hyphomonadaceae bacterium]|nr:outer membrane beta-barrel protein [Hyphomonadaceae bacterium]MBY0565249.1 outer membrane beta-barrel protein [Hyphomonadaceae bacterium]